jgi:hypothetical protein
VVFPGQSGQDDFDGRESRRFGDPIGNSFHESRFPVLPSHLHRGEFEGPGKLRMGEHLRSGDMIGLDGHLRRGEHLGPRNLPNHMRLGEPIGFGDYPGHARMGELAGLGNFESFGSGNRPGHPRFGEPGFRSSFSLQGFPNDGGMNTVKYEFSAFVILTFLLILFNSLCKAYTHYSYIFFKPFQFTV